ncbi:N-acetyltransferase 5 [Pelomyxa schiedti]|nr:N-acetyltransferase 5 [Pelomyxa schiedti]
MSQQQKAVMWPTGVGFEYCAVELSDDLNCVVCLSLLGEGCVQHPRCGTHFCQNCVGKLRDCPICGDVLLTAPPKDKTLSTTPSSSSPSSKPTTSSLDGAPLTKATLCDHMASNHLRELLSRGLGAVALVGVPLLAAERPDTAPLLNTECHPDALALHHLSDSPVSFITSFHNNQLQYPTGSELLLQQQDNFDVACKFILDNLAVFKYVTKCLRGVTKLEEERSKALSLVSKHFQDDVKPPCLAQNELLRGLTNQVNAESEVSHTLSESITNKVCLPLKQALPDLESFYRQFVSEGTKNAHDYRNSVSKLERSRAAFIRVNKELGQTHDAPKRAKLTQDLAQSTKDYQVQIEETNGMQTKFLAEAKRVLEEMQKLDSRRSELLSTHLTIFFDIHATLPAQIQDQIGKWRDLQQSSNYQNDLVQFVVQNRSGAPPPPPFEFEAYKPEGVTDRPKSLRPAWLKLGTLKKKEAEDLIQPGLPPKPLIYGVSLDEIVSRQKEKYPNLRIPMFLILMRDTLYTLEAPTTEGIFRVPANQNELNKYRAAFDLEEFYISETASVHTICALLKLFLRELPVAVIPQTVYSTFINQPFIDSINSENVESLVFDKLPENHRDVCLFLLKMIHELAAYSSETKMDKSNLSMVFAPGLLRCPLVNSPDMVQLYELERAFVLAIASRTPTKLYDSLNTTLSVRPTLKGPDEPYDGKGFEVLTEEQITQIRKEIAEELLRAELEASEKLSLSSSGPLTSQTTATPSSDRLTKIGRKNIKNQILKTLGGLDSVRGSLTTSPVQQPTPNPTPRVSGPLENTADGMSSNQPTSSPARHLPPRSHGTLIGAKALPAQTTQGGPHAIHHNNPLPTTPQRPIREPIDDTKLNSFAQDIKDEVELLHTKFCLDNDSETLLFLASIVEANYKLASEKIAPIFQGITSSTTLNIVPPKCSSLLVTQQFCEVIMQSMQKMESYVSWLAANATNYKQIPPIKDAILDLHDTVQGKRGLQTATMKTSPSLLPFAYKQPDISPPPPIPFVESPPPTDSVGPPIDAIAPPPPPVDPIAPPPPVDSIAPPPPVDFLPPPPPVDSVLPPLPTIEIIAPQPPVVAVPPQAAPTPPPVEPIPIPPKNEAEISSPSTPPITVPPVEPIAQKLPSDSQASSVATPTDPVAQIATNPTIPQEKEPDTTAEVEEDTARDSLEEFNGLFLDLKNALVPLAELLASPSLTLEVLLPRARPLLASLKLATEFAATNNIPFDAPPAPPKLDDKVKMFILVTKHSVARTVKVFDGIRLALPKLSPEVVEKALTLLMEFVDMLESNNATD